MRDKPDNDPKIRILKIRDSLPNQCHQSSKIVLKQPLLIILTILLSAAFFTANSQNTETKTTKERYLMITPPVFEKTLTEFAEYKQKIGFDVQVVNTDITGKKKSDIKNYIQNQYDNISTRPVYVLLVGDVKHIPAFEGNPSGKVKENPISDLGYSLLEGNDNFADVFLGRFSVSNENELKNMIDKTIYMETNMHSFNKKAVFVAGDEKKGVWNRAYMRNSFLKVHKNIIHSCFIPLGYDCQELYFPNRTEVVNALNDNPLFFIYAGHGNFTSFAGKTFVFEYKDIAAATNTVYPIVFAFSCKTGNFGQICIGEYFTREKEKGAVAYFGSSVNTQTNSDPIVAKKIFEVMAKNEAQSLSEAINLGMRRYYHAIGVSKKKKNIYLKAFNLLGDPSFKIKQ
jgi:hypothetical protein